MLHIFKAMMAIVIIVVSYQLALLLFHPLNMLAGTGPLGIILLPVTIVIFIIIAGLLGFGSWNLMNYFLEKKALNENPEQISSTDGKMGISTIFLKTIKGTGILLFIFACFVVFEIADLKMKASQRYDQSFKTSYPVNDYNDSRIIFYNKELEKASKNFILANDTYHIFKADIKQEIALACIGFFQKEHNHQNPYKQKDNFKKNARNKYANTNELIEKAKKNEKYLNNNLKIYRYYAHYYHIKSTLDKEFNKSCKKQIDTEGIYEKYIPLYIKEKKKNMEHYLSYVKSGSKYHNSYQYKKQSIWLDTLQTKHPEYFKKRKD